MTPHLPPELIEQVARGESILILGPELPAKTGDGHKSRRLLAAELARRCAVDLGGHTLTQLAQYYEMKHSRNQLVRLILDHHGVNEGPVPTQYLAITKLPFSAIVDLDWSTLIERAFVESGGRYSRVVRNSQVSYIDATRTLLIKMYGTVDDPETLVITEDDHFRLLTEISNTSIVLRAMLATKTLVFLGFDSTDLALRQLYQQVSSSVDRDLRRAYVIFDTCDDYEVLWWNRHNVDVLRMSVTSFASALNAELNSTGKRAAEPPSRPMALPPEPFKFLDYYDTDDSVIFMGRERESGRLVDHVLAHRFTVLYGRSGSGKTSLLKAGTLPLLESQGYRTIYVRPLESPDVAIQKVVRALASEGHSSGNLNDLDLPSLVRLAVGPEARLVVIIDQFEEFFIRLGPEARQKAALSLRQCLELGDIDMRFVISIRDDFFHHLEELQPHLREFDVFRNRFFLGQLDAESAFRAILEPARLYSIEFESHLAEQIVVDLGAIDIEPAQLQVICSKLYKYLTPPRTSITSHDYVELGGARGILSRYLDDALSDLQGHLEADLVRAVLKCMVTAESTKEAMRAREIARDAIVRRSGVNQAQVVEILEMLRDRRIVRKLGDSGLYELAHDVMVEKVAEWIDSDDVRNKYLRGMLRQAVSDWIRAGVLLDMQRLELLREQSDDMSFDEDEARMLLASALALGLDTAYWYGRAKASEVNAWQEVVDILATADPSSRLSVMELFEALLKDQDRNRASEVAKTAALSDYPAIRMYGRRLLKKVRADPGVLRGELDRDLIEIPEGVCLIGCTESPVASPEETPIHPVELDRFWIGRFPVTNDDYLRFVEATSHDAPFHWKGRSISGRRLFHPVVNVTWFDANAYCEWLSNVTGRKVRLPTEAEWEKAASWEGNVGRKRIYAFGDEFDPKKCNCAASGIGDTSPVGNFLPVGGGSWYGVADATGNVWNWTSSRGTREDGSVFAYPYDPEDGRELHSAGGMRVLRGGAFDLDHLLLRTTYRSMFLPNYRLFSWGFRIASSEQ
jgi:formylglycine-generating enzyme required for sulfatase activity